MKADLQLAAQRAFILLMAILFSSVAQTHKASIPQDVIYLKANRWVVAYSRGTKLVQVPRGAWYFDFPAPPDHVNYLMVPYHARAPHKFLSLTVKITTLSGNPVFNSRETCVGGMSANVRPMIQRQGDNMISEFGRWWSNPEHFELKPTNGNVTITVPLTPNHWSSVYGKFGNYNSTTLSEFKKTLRAIQRVGLTFGGGCAFGHGINVSGGKARFELIDYRIW
jgi:hypothetical protein